MVSILRYLFQTEASRQTLATPPLPCHTRATKPAEKYGLVASLLVVVLFSATGRSSAAQPFTRFEFAEIHMGTRFKIVLYAPDAEQGARASRAAFDRIAHLDEIMSDYRQDSELMRLCARAGGHPVKVSEDLFRVISRSQEIARK